MFQGGSQEQDITKKISSKKGSKYSHGKKWGARKVPNKESPDKKKDHTPQQKPFHKIGNKNG